jgi:hypothetical protein
LNEKKIEFICQPREAMALTVEAYRLSELEEVLGELHSVENTEIGMIAIIGKISVLLPEDLAEDLMGLIGKRIGILRLDGYRVRCVDREVIAQERKFAMAAPKPAQGVA